MDHSLTHGIGQILPLAVALALSPLPIISMVLLLMSPRARTSGIAFLVGRVVGISLVLGVILAASELLYSLSSSVELPRVVRVVLGVALIALGLSKWRPRPEGSDPTLPGWMSSVSEATAPRALGFGILMTVINVKEFAFLVTAGVVLASDDLDLGGTLLAWAVLIVVSSVTVAGPLIAYLVSPDAMRPRLDALQKWLTANMSLIVGVVLLVIGAVVLGNALG